MRKIITIIFSSLVISGYAQYDVDRHNTSYSNGWLSCESSPSPNTTRGESHWIMYDFGQIYSLGTSHVWNTNVSDNLNLGIKTMVIDYSTDGVTWLSSQEVEIPMADASTFYTGNEGPDLNGIEARYILITALTNYGGECVGFSEIKFNTAGVVSDVTDIDELDGSIAIFPNPMDGSGEIELVDIPSGNYQYFISDILGRVLLNNSLKISSEKVNIHLDVKDFINGIYSITLTDGSKLKSKSFEILNKK